MRNSYLRADKSRSFNRRRDAGRTGQYNLPLPSPRDAGQDFEADQYLHSPPSTEPRLRAVTTPHTRSHKQYGWDAVHRAHTPEGERAKRRALITIRAVLGLRARDRGARRAVIDSTGKIVFVYGEG